MRTNIHTAPDRLNLSRTSGNLSGAFFLTKLREISACLGQAYAMARVAGEEGGVVPQHRVQELRAMAGIQLSKVD
jgi:hypothetical protein